MNDLNEWLANKKLPKGSLNINNIYNQNYNLLSED